jgi:periplasmic divalent cation tolerance protein
MYKVLITTSNNYSVLEKIVNECVRNKKISPCAHIINNISSFYLFNDNFINDKEHLLIIKCKNENLKLISNIIRKTHNYNTPEIISFQFDILSKKYNKWFDSNEF